MIGHWHSKAVTLKQVSLHKRIVKTYVKPILWVYLFLEYGNKINCLSQLEAQEVRPEASFLEENWDVTAALTAAVNTDQTT